MLPAELVEMGRSDGIPRTVLCFLDEDGYLGNLECVYYDDAIAEWPDPKRCAVLTRDKRGHPKNVVLPGGASVRPIDPDDRWMSFEEQEDGGFCASTGSGHRECWAADGARVSHTNT